jgi:subtilisin family serine protease
MDRKSIVILLLAISLPLWTLSQTRVLIKFKPGTPERTRDSILNVLQLKPVKEIGQLRMVLCESPKTAALADLRKAAESIEEVEYVEEDYIYTADEQVTTEEIQAKLSFSLDKLQEMEFAQQRLIVRFRSDATPEQIRQFLQSRGMEKVKEFTALDLQLLRTAPGVAMRAAIVSVAAEAIVEYVEPDFIVRALEVPNDPRFSQQWGLHNTGQTGGTADADIDAPEAWEEQTGSPSVLVGIIDTGIDYRHEDLQSNIWVNPGEYGGGKETNGVDDDGNGYVDDWRGWDFANGDNDPMDDNGHGTHVAGIVAASGNNGAGVAGVCWKAGLVPLKFLRADGSGYVSDAIEAVLYAADMGIRILNNSWGGRQYSRALEDAIRYANDRGVLFVAAAGNDGENNDTSPHYPSNYEVANVISVAASTDRDRRADFSNYGEETVDLAAPGERILSTYPGNRYEWLSGTSMATPFVTGVAALVAAEFPGIALAPLKLRLLGGVDYLSAWEDLVKTDGRLNAFRALSRKPLIALTTDYDDTDNPDGPYVISTYVVDDGQVQEVFLVYWRAGESGKDSLQMQYVNPNHYQASIPGHPTGTTVRYYVSARDDVGFYARSRTFQFRVTRIAACCGQLAISLKRPPSGWPSGLLVLMNVLLLIAPWLYLRYRARKRPAIPAMF